MKKKEINYFFKLLSKEQKNFIDLIKIKIIKKYIYIKYNCFIGETAKIGKNLKLPHQLNGIFISNSCEIGFDCTIFHQVTIGSNFLEMKDKDKGAPYIGNNVYIGAGAKIIGSIKIGDNVKIGANCVVVTDIPKNATVVMNKPRILLKKGEEE